MSVKRIVFICIILLISYPFLAGGIKLYSYASGVQKRIEDSLKWPSVKGNVVHFKIERVEEMDNFDEELEISYKPEIFVEYSVDGYDYNTSKMILMGNLSYDEDEADEIAELESKYIQGEEADVFYNPENPEEAIMEPSEELGVLSNIMIYISYGLFAGFGIFAFIALLIGVFGLKKSKQA